VPLLARAWADVDPVLFFEFDPDLTRRSGDEHPEHVWDELEQLGYVHAAVWTNFGTPLGNGSLQDLRTAAAALERTTRDSDLPLLGRRAGQRR